MTSKPTYSSNENMKPIRRNSAVTAFVSIVSLVVCTSVVAEQSVQEGISEKLKEVARACEEPGRILAEAPINKWKNAGQNILDKFGDDRFSVVSKLMQQQCISINHVALLRLAKSYISAEEAVRIHIDREIAKQMEIIERTL